MTSTPRALSKRRVIVVDDHPIVRRGLALTIGQEPDLEVCGEAADVGEALQQMEQRQPDIVVIDITLGGEDGIELIDYVKSRWPSVKILVCSAHDEETFAGRVLRRRGHGLHLQARSHGQDRRGHSTGPPRRSVSQPRG